MPHFRTLGPRTALVFIGCLLVAGSVWGQPAGSEVPLRWEEFRDHLGLANRDALDASPLGNSGGYAENALWTVVASILVFWMQAGFALVEAGFTRAKNAVNILMKNMMDFAVGSIAYWAIGFGLMFGVVGNKLDPHKFFIGSKEDTWIYTFLLFQTVFAGTSATIVSGAMAERTKFTAYLVYSLFISALVYPIFGSFAWGSLFGPSGWLEAPAGGFLASFGLPRFIDFAGSTVVHSVGGWAALAGVIVLGPRLGKYGANATPIRGHSMSLATLGVFILWMGWFGFNAGSTTGVTGGLTPYAGSGKAIGLIAINTNLAACAGMLTATLVTWLRTGKPEISMSLNGVLAGLVAITAGCAVVSPPASLCIGGLAGILIVFSVEFWDSLRIDDPVGAISVHGVCGAWGTLAVAIFHHDGFDLGRLKVQILGILAAFVWSFGTSFLLFHVIARTLGLRVHPDDELDGLDLSEHGCEAYPREN
jgi:ammonium transporter, Amt family